MIEEDFISFPTINKISVHNYPLFNYGQGSNWSATFENGLNLFLGANSIGKTTTINMVIYGIVGDFKNVKNTNVNSIHSKNLGVRHRIFTTRRNSKPYETTR